jgi:hypothetical protein
MPAPQAQRRGQDHGVGEERMSLGLEAGRLLDGRRDFLAQPLRRGDQFPHVLQVCRVRGTPPRLGGC